MEILNDGVTTGMVWYQWWHPSRLIYISFQGISDKYQGKYSRSDNLGQNTLIPFNDIGISQIFIPSGVPTPGQFVCAYIITCFMSLQQRDWVITIAFKITSTFCTPQNIQQLHLAHTGKALTCGNHIYKYNSASRRIKNDINQGKHHPL